MMLFCSSSNSILHSLSCGLRHDSIPDLQNHHYHYHYHKCSSVLWMLTPPLYRLDLLLMMSCEMLPVLSLLVFVIW